MFLDSIEEIVAGLVLGPPLEPSWGPLGAVLGHLGGLKQMGK
jgi:hypothetical protein